MNLLVTVSKTPYADENLDLIAKLAGDDPVALVHAIEDGGGGRRATGDGAAAQLVQTSSPALTHAQERLAARGVRADVVIEHGAPAPIVLRVAASRDVDLVVMRANDRAPSLVKRVFGDTVTRVLERSDVPVLALRTGFEAAGHGILLASGRPGVTMLDDTALVARATGSPVTVLHVEPQGENEDFFQDLFQRPEDAAAGDAPKRVRSLERAVEALRARGATASARVRAGIVEDQLAREANHGDHWLLVVRGRSTSRLWRAVLGHSFTEDLVRHVRTSILVVK